MFVRLDLEKRSHVFLHSSDRYENMLALPENWIVDDVAVKQDWVCLCMSTHIGMRGPRRHAIFLVDLNNMSGIFLWRTAVSSSAYLVLYIF